MSSSGEDPAESTISAVAAGMAFGLYPASDFRLVDGRCADCLAIPQALWYFEGETIAVPKDGVAVASFATGVSATDDLRAWQATRPPGATPEYPPLVWVAAPHVAAGARISEDARSLKAARTGLRLSLTPRIPLNRSYFDDASARFFHARTVRVRGRIAGGAIVARTLWPEDFRIDGIPPARPLTADLPTADALRALVRSEPAGGARSPFATSTLWQRDASLAAVAPGRAVLGIMLNGAQGDDDEAHAGHFALVTGRMQDDAAIGDWMVNNFYALDTESEKGIVAAPVPLDNYLADLNSGQGWYRPSQMIVAVLRYDRGAALLQSAMNRVYNQFWRHQLPYRHATMNCTGISIDVVRALGWRVPVRGPASRLAAALGFPWFVFAKRSIAQACVAFDYLNEDQTRLLPAAAFEEMGASLVALAGARPARGESRGELARMLSDDVEAILLVRFPQFPSSRVFGDAPVVSPWEFQLRMPAVPQIVPVPDRPFPATLRDPDLLAPPMPASTYAAMIWGVISVVGIPFVIWRIWKWWRERSASH